MNTQDLETAIKATQISPDAYAMWRDNIVTKRFMLEMEAELMSRRASWPSGSTCEAIALAHVGNSAACMTLEDMIEWKPAELQTEDN